MSALTAIFLEIMRRKRTIIYALLPLVIALAFISLSSCHNPQSTENQNTSVPPPCSWNTSSLSAQGIDSSLIGQAEQQFRAALYVESFILVRNGFLVQEQYYSTAGIFTNDDIASVTKSFTSAFVGIALKQGYLDSLGQKLMDFFPEYSAPTLDSTKHLITIEDLLTMRSGFDYDENQDYSNLFNTNTNWMKEGIDLPMKWVPGDTFNYASIDAHLVSGILTKASHMSTKNLATTYLLQPLGISILDWPQDPQGYFYGAARMVVYPRDLAKFGYLYLNNGTVDGQSILPSDWVKTSMQPHVYPLDNWGDFKNVSYGYFWWTAKWNADSVFMAVGFGGQFIICVPALNVVVVITCDQNCTAAQADLRQLSLLNVVSKKILSAVKN